jgi:hypothetical protein
MEINKFKLKLENENILNELQHQQQKHVKNKNDNESDTIKDIATDYAVSKMNEPFIDILETMNIRKL